jgi:hypothetical protein
MADGSIMLGNLLLLVRRQIPHFDSIVTSTHKHRTSITIPC